MSNYYTQSAKTFAFVKSTIRTFLFLFFQLITVLVFSQEDFNYLPPKFQNLSLKDGLSNLAIHSICQDDLGYIWIGTARGLNRYDGISFKHYYYSDDENSLYHDDIIELHKAPNGDVFCRTRSGINIYNIEKEKLIKKQSFISWQKSFVNYESEVYSTKQSKGLYRYNTELEQIEPVENFPKNDRVDKLVSEKNTGIWGKAVNNQFIINYNPKTSSYKKYFLPNTDTLITGGTLSLIQKHLIISTNTNISIFNIEKESFEDIRPNYKGLVAIKNKTISFIKEVEKDILWIGTKANGLYVYDVKNRVLKRHVKTEDSNTLNSNHLTCILKDLNNNIWLGTFDRGLEVAFESRKNFNFDLTLHNFTKDKFVTSICTDNRGNYYIGTRLNGLYTYNVKTKRTSILNEENSFIEDNNIRSLLLSSKNELWISSEKQLHILNLKSGKHRNLEIPKPNNGLVSFCESNNKIFAGSDKQGLLVFSLEGKLLDTITQFNKNIIQVLKQDDGKLIVAAHSVGCFVYDYENNHSVNINKLIPPGEKNFEQVVTVYIDSKENLWIGSFKYGLYRISKDKKEMAAYTMKDGLPSNDITGIIEDNKGNIWISTAYGLSMLNKQGRFTNYSYNQGLENIQFHQKATLKDGFGTLFFGGNFGLTFFNPKMFKLENKQAPKILLETLKVSNQKVEPGDDTGILTKNLALTS